MNSPNDPKEQNNLMIAVVLSLAVLLGWQYFFARPQIQQEHARREFSKQIDEQRKGSEGIPGVASGNNPIAAPSPSSPVGSSQSGPVPTISREAAVGASSRVPIHTNSLDGSIDLKSGRIDDLVLKKYRETVDPNSQQVVLLSPAGAPEPYFVEFGWIPSEGAALKVPDRDTEWKLENGTTLTATTPVTLAWDNGQGLIFRRTVSVDEDYMFKIADQVENKSANSVSLRPYARVHRYGHPTSQAFYILHEGLVGVSGEQGLQEVTYANAIKDGVPKTIENAVGGWLGITDKYWATSLIPDQAQPYRAMYSAVKARTPEEKDAFQADYLRAPVVIAPNSQTTVDAQLYAGAKQASLIDGYGAKDHILLFDRMIDWGWFYYITRPLFWLMEKINGFVHNFGITILFLTVLVKAVFYPLANRQYESMARMKKLQPEMARIKEVYKDDPQRQQKEIFEFYRKEKINPLAGCWPILLQIPVFFALYKVLFVTIDMRHAPFFGWIHDLSAPDPTSLFNLFGLLPFDAPHFLHVGIWPIIMGVTMWIQMQLNPPQPDPVQQQIFQWMPLMFTFLLASFPVGLVIYWAWSNTLSIAQQWYINKKNGAETHLLSNMRRVFSPLFRLFGRGDGDSK